MNIQCAFQIVVKIIEQGVHTFCLCPGGRNAPFVEILSRLKKITVLYFFDEKSAGFFALGRAKRDAKPVAVVTTSGTAVGELYPAVIEAYYSNTPLILITADRPWAYKNTSAPQCIDQVNIFSKYAHKTIDIEVKNKPYFLKRSNPQKTLKNHIKKILSSKIDHLIDILDKPIHINVRFDEPLIDETEPQNIDFNQIDCVKNEFHKNSKLTFREKFQIQSFFKKSSSPIILLAGLPLQFKNPVEKFLLSLNFPIYAEPLSQLRESKKLKCLILKSGEEILKKAIAKKWVDGVIRIGAIPVTRFWRDLNEIDVPVLSLSLSDFSGLQKRPKACSLHSFLNDELKYLHFLTKNQKSKYKKSTHDFYNHQYSALLKEDTRQSQHLENKIQSNVELSWFRWLSEKLPKHSHIFLGNSLPIREWNLSAIRENKQFIYTGNRGANGIDGLLSSFFGLCSPSNPNYCILGDLSALYDLSSPWILNQMKDFNIHIIVINNFGGKIFKDKFKNPAYLNSHCIHFKNFSKMWNIHYQLIKNSKPFLQKTSLEMPSPSLTEIQIYS